MKFVSQSNVPSPEEKQKLDLHRRSAQEFYLGVATGMVFIFMMFWLVSIAVAQAF